MNMLKPLYGMLRAALLYYKKFVADIRKLGYKVNPHDPCIANKTINNKQHTLTWHVDDVKLSHVDPDVNDKFGKWCERMHGSKELGHVKITRGKVHDYLGMTLNYSMKGKIQVDMRDYVKGILEDFPHELKSATSPWTGNLFKVDVDSKSLNKEKSEIFHTFVMKCVFLCKKGWPDIEPGVCFLST